MCKIRVDAVNPSRSESPAFPDPNADYFSLFGLGQGFDVDRELLEARYLELSVRFHPDKYVGAPLAERRRVVELASAINQAYRTLRSPPRRAEYLCRLMGIDLDSSEPGTGAPAMEQSFLVRMLDEREQLEEAQERGLDAVEDFRMRVEDQKHTALQAAVAALAQKDADAAARHLVMRRYLDRLLAEIDGVEPG